MNIDKKTKLSRNIFMSIMEHGVETSKADILSNDPIEDKVYTKRINIGKDYGDGPNVVKVVCVSLTSGSNDWNTIKNEGYKVKNVRINTQNTQGKWCNIFVNEATTEMLEFVFDSIPQEMRVKHYEY